MLAFGSLCSGIEAASAAWLPLGWKCRWVSEIDPFCCTLLKHYYPDTLNLGDMTKVEELLQSQPNLANIDVLVAGTPCTAFSIAGLRQSLNDARGNLTLVFCRIVAVIDEIRNRRGQAPLIMVWENVPGVLNTHDNAFGCLLGALAGEGAAIDTVQKWPHCGLAVRPERKVAWRVLDAEGYVPQRRTRVFVCASGHARGFDPGRVLFESKTDLEGNFGACDRSEIPALIQGLRWDFATRGKARQKITSTLRGGAAGGSRHGKRGGSDDPGVLIPEVAKAIRAHSGGIDREDGHVLIPEIIGPLGSTTASGGVRTTDTEFGAFIPEVSYAVSAGRGGSKFGSGRHNQDTFIPEVAAPLSSAEPSRRGGGSYPTPGHFIASKTAVSFQSRIARCGRGGPKEIVDCLRSDAGKSGKGGGAPLIAEQVIPFDTAQITSPGNYSAPGPDHPRHPLASTAHVPTVAVAFTERGRAEGQRLESQEETAYALTNPGAGGRPQAPAYGIRTAQTGANGIGITKELCQALDSPRSQSIALAWCVRRLTPREAERLQGFPDDYTLIPVGKGMASDSQRYRVLGNSMAVPVMNWIGRRVAAEFASASGCEILEEL